MSFNKSIKNILLASLILLISNCTSVHYNTHMPIACCQKWAVFDFNNLTQSPYANLRAQSIAAAILNTHNIAKVFIYKNKKQSLIDTSISSLSRKEIEWALSKGIRYGLTGTITEWGYKNGIDGEPIVGITLSIIDLRNDKIIARAAGSKSGLSRQGVTYIAQNLLNKMLNKLM